MRAGTADGAGALGGAKGLAEDVIWVCERGCGDGGVKTYGSAAEAARFARAFDQEDRADLGRRAPFLGLFPLRIGHWLRTRANRSP